MGFSPEQAGLISATLLSTVEAFADTAPTIADHKLEFGEISEGEAPSVRLMELSVAGERFLMIAKRVGG